MSVNLQTGSFPAVYVGTQGSATEPLAPDAANASILSRATDCFARPPSAALRSEVTRLESNREETRGGFGGFLMKIFHPSKTAQLDASVQRLRTDVETTRRPGETERDLTKAEQALGTFGRSKKGVSEIVGVFGALATSAAGLMVPGPVGQVIATTVAGGLGDVAGNRLVTGKSYTQKQAEVDGAMGAALIGGWTVGSLLGLKSAAAVKAFQVSPALAAVAGGMVGSQLGAGLVSKVSKP